MHPQVSCPGQRYQKRQRFRSLQPGQRFFQCFQSKNCDKHVGNSYLGALDWQVHSLTIPECISDTPKFLFSKYGSCLQKWWQEFTPSIQPSRHGFLTSKQSFLALISQWDISFPGHGLSKDSSTIWLSSSCLYQPWSSPDAVWPKTSPPLNPPMWRFPKIGGSPKSSILIGFSTINHPSGP